MLDFKKMAAPGSEKYMAVTEDDVCFVVTYWEKPERVTMLVGRGGFTELVCRATTRDADTMTELAVIVEEHLNGVDLSDDSDFTTIGGSHSLHGMLVRGHTLSENGRLYKIVELPRLDGRRLVASLHVFEAESDKGTRCIDARFEDLRMAKHAAHCLAMYYSDPMNRLS